MLCQAFLYWHFNTSVAFIVPGCCIQLFYFSRENTTFRRWPFPRCCSPDQFWWVVHSVTCEPSTCSVLVVSLYFSNNSFWDILILSFVSWFFKWVLLINKSLASGLSTLLIITNCQFQSSSTDDRLMPGAHNLFFHLVMVTMVTELPVGWPLCYWLWVLPISDKADFAKKLGRRRGGGAELELISLSTQLRHNCMWNWVRPPLAYIIMPYHNACVWWRPLFCLEIEPMTTG